jgi:hypothetical protein
MRANVRVLVVVAGLALITLVHLRYLADTVSEANTRLQRHQSLEQERADGAKEGVVAAVTAVGASAAAGAPDGSGSGDVDPTTLLRLHSSAVAMARLRDPPVHVDFTVGVTDVDALPVLDIFEKEPQVETDLVPLRWPDAHYPAFTAPYDMSEVPKEGPEVRGKGCAFDGCPGDGPYVYMLTSHRNRGAHLNLWIRSMYGG